MNYLALAQDLARQSGTLAGGVTITNVTGNTGRADKMVAWVNQAWEDIQNQRQWQWLRTAYTATLLPNTPCYTAASFNCTRFGNWVEDYQVFSRIYRAMTIYDPAMGQSNENDLAQIPWELWKNKYDRRTHVAKRPTEWAISPIGEICLGPTPDMAYTLRGEYWKTIQELTVNGDIPESPARYHRAIVWRAMQMIAEADESIPSLQMADREYHKLFGGMCNDRQCLPQFSMMTEPLA